MPSIPFFRRSFPGISLGMSALLPWALRSAALGANPSSAIPVGLEGRESSPCLFLQLRKPICDQLERSLGSFLGVVDQQALAIGGNVEQYADGG